MNNTVLALLVGLIAGAAGGFLPKLISGDESATVVTSDAGAIDGDVSARLARIEATLGRLADGGMSAAGGLSGSSNPGGFKLDEASLATLKEMTKASVKEGLSEHKEANPDEAIAIEAGGMGRGNRKRMKLADAAKELELSAQEEDNLRQIYSDTFEKTLKMLAGDDGDIEDVRRDLEAVRADPSKGMSLMGKYLPRVFPAKIGEFIGLRTSQDAKVREAIGTKKADKLRDGYNIEEANPMPIGGNMRMGSRFGGR